MFVWSDLVILGITAIASLLSIAGWVVPNELGPRLLLTAVAVGMIGITVLMYVERKRQLSYIRFVSHGITVAWSDPKYAVNEIDFSREVKTLLVKLQNHYMSSISNPLSALAGTLVFFTTPTTMLGRRKVAGFQDNQIIVVGWNEDLSKSALQHELAHRVLQVFFADPDEATAHEIMSRLGV